ncbi:AAA family ATPase [Candidatus Bathyarchaeota archaeon]|nr:AAA family ATPase [Candidatus Bathyarchaeota archaeon]
MFQDRESRIFKDSTWLQPLSDPPGGKPLCREADLTVMAAYLSEIFRAGQARNLFIHGKPGTGKTVCIRHLLSEINRHTQQTNAPVMATYVNAGRTRTPYYTMLEIVKGLGLNVPDAGWQMFRLKQAFERLLRDKSIVIAIDEVDSIIFKEKEPLVYYLNRQPKTTLILLSNTVEDATQLPERALSTLQPRLLLLKPYTFEETKKILKERVEYAFQPGVISNKLLNKVAKIASKTGDIRLGFSLLLSAGHAAEVAGKSRIDAEDVQSAVESETRVETLKKIDEIHKQIEKWKKNRRKRVFKLF